MKGDEQPLCEWAYRLHCGECVLLEITGALEPFRHVMVRSVKHGWLWTVPGNWLRPLTPFAAELLAALEAGG